jgi:hypothetical protein
MYADANCFCNYFIQPRRKAVFLFDISLLSLHTYMESESEELQASSKVNHLRGKLEIASPKYPRMRINNAETHGQ